MRYFVIATVWSEEVRKQVKIIAGEFDTYMNASLFKNAYNEHYNANAYIANSADLLNKEEQA